MSVKKWVGAFFAVLLAVIAVLALFNLATDPFGVFGDPVLRWYEYDMTMNPRVAKIAYLDRNHGKYDSYIIGSSKSSSLSPEELGGYLGGRFYNMTWYGGDIADERDLVRYIINNYGAKNIVLAVDPQDAVAFDTESDPIKGNMHAKVDRSGLIAFYGKYLFANPGYGLEKLRDYFKRGYLTTPASVYVAETGVYNKQLRDVSPIGAMDEYMAREQNYYKQPQSDLPYLDDALEAYRQIVDMCDEAGVKLTVIGVPLYEGDFSRYDRERFTAFWTGLAEIHELWDFWGGGSVAGDLRYFYDVDHFRNCVGTMVLARIFGNSEVYVPEGFGHLTTAENAREHIDRVYAALGEPAESHAAAVPVLMYHSFTRDSGAITDMITLDTDFDAQMAALRDAGYTAISYGELLDYVYRGTDLPDRPVLITIDDGYMDNLDIAAPILEKYGLRATVSVIGVSVGKDTYKDTGVAMIPHFPLEAAAPYVERGVLDITSHSFDMHQVPERDGEDCRKGVLRMEGETEDEYVETLSRDFLRSKEQISSVLGSDVVVFTYPYGRCDTMSEVVLRSLGVLATATTENGVNVVLKGIPQCLYSLKRINVPGGMSAETLTETLDGRLVETSLD